MLFIVFHVKKPTKSAFPSPEADQKATNQKLQHLSAQRIAISSKLLSRSTFFSRFRQFLLNDKTEPISNKKPNGEHLPKIGQIDGKDSQLV